MSLKFDLDQYYFLLQAFDQLGRHLYRAEWTGREAFAAPAEDPEILASKYRELQDKLDQIDVDLLSLRQKGGRLESGSEKEQIDQQLFSLQKEEQELLNKRSALPHYRDTMVTDYDQYQRGQKVREILFAGFADQHISAMFGIEQIIDWKIWRGFDEFEISIPLSRVMAPPQYSSLSEAVVFVSKPSFDQWHLKLQPLVETEPKVLSTKEKAIRLIALLAEQNSDMKKDECLQAMKAELPDLTQNAFNGIWRDHAPAHWKKPGRPNS